MEKYKGVNMQHEDDEFYVLNELLSHDPDVGIAQSIRNLGKSYDGLDLCIDRIEMKNQNCAWSRWDREELKVAEAEFERKVNMDEYKRFALTKSSGSIYENQTTGKSITFTAVKDYTKYKGIDIPDLRYWIYDEFLPEKYQTITRKRDEFPAWSSLYTTLRRNNKKFTALLISNCISWFNGYFDAWGILPFPSGQIKRYPQQYIDPELGIEVKRTIVMDNVKPTKAMIKRVVADEVLKGKTNEEIQAYLNNATKDITSFVEKCPDKSIPLSKHQWLMNDHYYSYRIYDGLMYFCEHAKRDGVFTLTLNKDELKPGIVRDRSEAKLFEDYINMGMMRFEDAGTQSAIYLMVQLGKERI